MPNHQPRGDIAARNSKCLRTMLAIGFSVCIFLTSRAASAQTLVNLGGQNLLNEGILPHILFINELAGNPSGGDKQGVTTDGTILAGVDFDLTKLANIQGAGIHFSMTERYGRSLADDDIGSTLGAQEAYGTENFRLTELTWDQALFSDRIEVEAGRMTPVSGDSFADALSNCQFVGDSICGAPYLVSFDTSEDVWPISSWGGQIRLYPTNKIYIEAAASEDDRYFARTNDQGFDWGISHATGVFVPVGIGYRTTSEDDLLPRWYRVGYAYDSSPYSDPYTAKDGGSLEDDGLEELTKRNRGIFWIEGTQKVWRSNLDSSRGIDVIAGALFGTSDADTFKREFYAGIEDTGPVPQRPLDTLNFLFNDFQIGSKTLLQMSALRQAAGGSGAFPNNEMSLELNYGFQATPAITLRPNLQYIINPMNFFEPTKANIPNTFVVGLQLTMNIGTLVGLPTGFYHH